MWTTEWAMILKDCKIQKTTTNEMIREDVKEYNHFYAYAIHKDMCMYMYV